MTTNVDGGATSTHAAREVRWRLEEERRTRTSQLTELEQSTERAPREQQEASDYSHLANLRQSLAEIDDALRRLERGTYGTCERCDTGIPAGRLEILPYARYCVRCQGLSDRAAR